MTVEATGPPAAQADDEARRRTAAVWWLFGVAVLVGLVVRAWQVGGRAPSWWQDSTDYLSAGNHPLVSVAQWAGDRPPLVPVLLRFTGGKPGADFVVLQAIVAAVAWAWLAVRAAWGMPTTSRRVVAVVAVVTFSLTTPVTLWDRSVLSESLGISLLVALLAAGLWLLQRPGAVPVAVLTVLAAAWALDRDTNSVALAAVGLALLGWWAVARARRRDRSRARLLVVVACALLGVAALSQLSASVGQRQALPLADVFSVRVLPYPDRIDWFAAHGMPEADRFRREAAGLSHAKGRAPMVVLPRDDPALASWWSWLRRDGRGAFAEFVITHPTYLVTEPLARPERTFNNAGGDVLGYRASDMPEVPFVSRALWVSTATALLLALGIGVWWVGRGRPRTPLFAVAVLCVGASGVLGFVSWHTGGMETARHVFLGSVGLRVGVLLGLLAVVEGLPVPDRSRPGRGSDDGRDVDQSARPSRAASGAGSARA